MRKPADAPKQGFEGAPDAWVKIEPPFVPGLGGLRVGQDILLLTWLHEARRDVLVVHPRDDPTQPLTGVFATRSQDRPNPIGVHRVRVRASRPTGREFAVRDPSGYVLGFGEEWPVRTAAPGAQRADAAARS